LFLQGAKSGRWFDINIELSRQSEKFLLQLDEHTRKRIVDGLLGLKERPQKGDIKKMKGKDKELRLRIGKYRAVFANLPDFVYIIKIETRQKVYKLGKGYFDG
jgi:mRNA-degrading endonuclease RelE of RelBE toxin-antitoxin system